jgi:molecular chaperone DnaK (HSP70)
MDYILGIDLGTSNTVVFVNEGNKRTKVVKFDGENSFPTLVGKAKSGE